MYNHAAEIIKTAVLQGQYEALKGINRIQLATYYWIGKYVSLNTRKGFWGTGALEHISNHLYKMLPGMRGYSSESLKKMRQFYEEWQTFDSAPADSIDTTTSHNSVITITELQHTIDKIDIFQELRIPNLAEFPVEDFFKVSFTHHICIFSGVKDIQARYYYIHRCAEEHLSAKTLKDIIKNDEYNKRNAIPNNFLSTFSDEKTARKAVLAFKDSYILDYINTEEIEEREYQDIDERILEKQIIHNIKKFIMSFGKDFAFVGNQYHLEIHSEEFFPDLLFFNRELNALVVIELKTGKFKPGYLGQLVGYLRILDDKVKKPHENPSIGIVLCKEANKSFVEYIIQDFDKPMGVDTYTTSKKIPEALKDALPDMDELK
ncbi:MAG: PDDEXK nuclease domain-containing protein, partial [Bacteroidales bacterium]|nr:PDDEXK nuclease domain-containing protein [Bacteroidales bacterium]